jgi:hypothetical protein
MTIKQRLQNSLFDTMDLEFLFGINVISKHKDINQLKLWRL